MFPQKVFVLGGTGKIGREIVSFARTLSNDLTYTSVSAQNSHKNISHLHLDLTDPNLSMARIIWDADVFVFAAGLNTSELATEKGKVFISNEIKILTQALEMGKRVLYFSSSRVAQYYDSDRDVFDDSMMQYIDYKINIENVCLKFDNAVVLRLGKVISKDFLQYRIWSENLARGNLIPVSSRVYCNPVHIEDVTKVAIESIFESHVGIIELWCKNQISYYEIAEIFLEEFDPILISKNLIADSFFPLPGLDRWPRISRDPSWIKLSWETSSHVFRDTIKKFLREHNTRSSGQ
jgi:dTDP-4-dehydrorhamnose reductase